MNKLIVAGYARKVPDEQKNERGWMLPHHDVRHPTKKKIHVQPAMHGAHRAELLCQRPLLQCTLSNC